MQNIMYNNGIISEGQLREFFNQYGKTGWLETFLSEYNGNKIYVFKETDITVRFSFEGDNDVYNWIIVEVYTDESGNEDLLLIQLDSYDYNLLNNQQKIAV